MTFTTDDDLYIRGAATLLASWEEYARGSAGAALKRVNGVSAQPSARRPSKR
jgi:hypothetical protein